MRTELRKAAEFAEVAEALAVPTSEVLAVFAQPKVGYVIAAYTPGGGDQLVGARLERDEEKILRAVHFFPITDSIEETAKRFRDNYYNRPS